MRRAMVIPTATTAAQTARRMLYVIADTTGAVVYRGVFGLFDAAPFVLIARSIDLHASFFRIAVEPGARLPNFWTLGASETPISVVRTLISDLLMEARAPALAGPRAGGALRLAHLYGRKPFCDKIFGELCGDVIGPARAEVIQGYPVNDTSRLASNPDPHAVLKQQVTYRVPSSSR